MKTGGHYWCDNPKCDDVAFGPVCQHCHRTARFVPDEIPPLTPPAKPRTPPAPVTQERGHQLFAEIRQKLSLL